MVDAIIGNQAFRNGRCYICFSLGLDKVETDYNLVMELEYTRSHNGSRIHSSNAKILHIHAGLLAVSFYLLFRTTLSLIFKKSCFMMHFAEN